MVCSLLVQPDYADSVFVPYAQSQLEKQSERHNPTEEKEGYQETGSSNQCDAKALETRVDESKTELFGFLSQQVTCVLCQ